MAETPWHFIRPNEANRYPRRIICFDTEARIEETKTVQKQTFRVACASFDLIDRSTLEPTKSETAVFWEPLHLWEWIDGHCKTKSRTVVFAHNLSYDLRISDCLRILPALGWSLSFLSIDSNRCVARFRKKGSSLLLCDLSSWLPTSLAKVADKLGLRKTPLPDWGAEETAWVNHCQRDVEITRIAVLELIRWLERNDMGSFRMTGPAQAMAAYRHKFLPHCGLLVHTERDVLDIERRAAWAGRCEVWKHGEISGLIHEWDFRLAYLTVARDAYVPVRFRGETGPLSIKELKRLSKHRALMSQCTVRTDRPLVPAKVGDGIGWPIGEFDTVLWDNELLNAATFGADITIHRTWVYMKFPAFTEWAQWLLGALDTNGLPVDSIERIMLKDWSRSLIGRFGARWPQWRKVAKLPNSDLELVPFVDTDTGESGAYLQNGRDWFERSGYIDAPDAMPAVMGYIMALSRVRLWNAMEIAGLHNVIYCDTDSLVVTEEGNENLLAKYPPNNPEGFIQKAQHKGGLFLGPRQIRLGTELRIAGLPKNAIQKGPRSFEAVMWEGMSEGIRRGHSNEVRIYRRAVRIKGVDKRRRHLANGRTEPFALTASGNPSN